MIATNLFLDVDGVLLGKLDPNSPEIVLARHAEEFLLLATSEKFSCRWLTTHCKGDSRTVLEYLRPHCPDSIMVMLAGIQPTNFRTLKTEVLEGDFYWIDDAPLAAEIEWLDARGLRERWIKVDTRRHPDDLTVAVKVLKALSGR